MLLTIAIVSMFIAVTAYTSAVFSEKKASMLHKKHLIVFSIGLVFDTIGTTSMGAISDGFSLDIHGLTGLLALILMLVHVLWAILVYFKGSESQKKGFHKYSMLVWILWLIPFNSGMVLNMFK